MNRVGIKGHQRQIQYLNFLLNSGKIPQVILFSGTSSIGKKLIARRFINSLFCKKTNPPCLNCPICKQIKDETFPDIIEMRPNEKGNIPIGNEEIREPGSVRWLIDRLSTKSISGKTGIIIDEIDKITEEGQNALLKTIEEPSEGTFFILITSSKNKLLPTILSRCTEIRYSPLSDADVKEIAQNKFRDISEFDLDLVSKISGGSVEIAEVITNHEIFNEVIDICRTISLFFAEGKIIEIDIQSIQKKIKIELLIDIMINIYRYILLSIIRYEKITVPDIQTIFIDDERIVKEILKILMLLKINLSHNLNIIYAFKAMFYSLLEKINSF